MHTIFHKEIFWIVHHELFFNNKNTQQWKAAEKFSLESLFIFIAQTTTITIKFSNENNLIIPGMQMNKKKGEAFSPNDDVIWQNALFE